LITRELLEQVTTFPHLREEHARMLKTIAAMGPEKACGMTTVIGRTAYIRLWRNKSAEGGPCLICPQ